MPAYASSADLVTRLPERDVLALADDTGPASSIADPAVAAIVDQALSDASNEMDVYLARRLAVPVTPVRPVLIGWCCALAALALYGRRPHLDAPQVIRDQAAAARASLNRVARGEIELGSPGPEPTSAPVSQMIELDAPPSIFRGDW